MRNSVKAVIDAYDGTTTFYVFDAEDPIVDALPPACFPRLFKDAAGDAGRRCARTCAIPEMLLALQAEVYGLYHMTDPQVFYNREDLWTVASDIAASERPERPTRADGAELRADEAARRSERSSSSRCCRSRRRTATT